MSKVYITNKSAHDFSSAASYGRFIFLSEGSINRYATNLMYRRFMEVLQDSKPDDYLLPTGLSTMNLIAATIFALKHRRLNLLLFKDGAYVERKLVFDDPSFNPIKDILTSDKAKALLEG